VKFNTLKDVDVRGKRVIVREDLNVPMKDGAIADETRITAALETLRYLHDHGAKTVILSHLGRPDGKPQDKYAGELPRCMRRRSVRRCIARAGRRGSGPVRERALSR
jgi:3-phosphoglycerate kinase